MELRVPSFAKVNLGLEVLDLRADGYHELRTLFQSIDLCDELEITLRPEQQEIGVECDDPAVPCDGSNLAVRAARELAGYGQVRGGARIRIRKRIPVGGGLGGGSSNAASVLLALDRLWRLRLGAAGLQAIARRLGADVPYFLCGGTALGLARGDEVYPLQLQVRAHVVLVTPGIAVSTAKVFSRLDAGLTRRENSTTIFRFVSSDLPGSARYSVLTNELERAALEEAPVLAEQVERIRGVLVQEGACLAALSGSGSTYFGLFDEALAASRAQAALVAAGFRALRARTLPLRRYQRVWSEALAVPGATLEGGQG